MRILAIDLGKSKSVACDFDSTDSKHKFYGIKTEFSQLRNLLAKTRPDRVVIEICNQAVRVGDEVLGARLELQVAHTNGSSCQWRKVKRKTDRDEALKLASLSSSNELWQVP